MSIKPNNAPAVTVKAPNTNTGGSSTNNAIFAPAVILGGLVLCELVYKFVMGAPSRFEGGDPVKGHVINADPRHVSPQQFVDRDMEFEDDLFVTIVKATVHQ